MYLYTGAVTQDLTVEQHSTWTGLVLNHPYRDCPALFQAINQEKSTGHHALHCLCLVSESTFIFIFVITLMSTCHSLRSHSPLKTVFGKIGDTYQAHCHTYKTHTMGTHHGGSGQHLDRDINAHKTADTEIEHAQEFHHVNTTDFEDSEPNNPAKLTANTRELDNLCQ